MKYLLPIIITLIPLLSSAQECDDIKTGEFITENENTGGSILKRSESIQEEIVEKLGVHIKYELTWTGKCSYVLYNGTLITGDPQFEGNKSDTLFVEITSVSPEGYEFRASTNFSDFESSGSVKRKK